MSPRRGALATLKRWAGGLTVRLLLVNVVVVLVPWAGLEYARWHERRLLAMLEQGMHDQAALVRSDAEASLAAGEPIDVARTFAVLRDAATRTRTRIRIVDAAGAVTVDSHGEGAPEGPEPPAPTFFPGSTTLSSPASPRTSWSAPPADERWPEIADRIEVRAALTEARTATFTRVREREPQVFLFVAEPITDHDRVVGVVYVTRSTQPVLEQMHRLRRGLVRLLAVSIALTLLVTFVLALGLTRPIERLAAAARRIAAGERDVKIPQGGPTQVRELSSVVATLVREQEERMRYIESFAADVAHELKSPITAIAGAAELLEGDVEPEQRARFLRNIAADTERLDRLVFGLLELSRIDATEAPLLDVALDPVIARVIERAHSVEQPVVHEGQRDLRVRAREQDLERALLNLVENALRFSPPQGTVTIHTAAIDADRVTIAVTDAGPGVPEPLRDRIFDRFFTTDTERTGTGLGLSIVRSVAERAGGRAELDRGHAPGARFVITLNAAAPK